MSLTPPSEETTKTQKVKAVKEPKPKKEKAPKPPKDPNAARAHLERTGIIRLNAGKEIKYRGQRLEWYELVKSFEGKTVKEFSDSNKGRANGKGTVQAPGGWLSFYVRDGAVYIEAAQAPEVVAAA